MSRNQFARLLRYYLALNNKTQSDMVKDLGFDKSTVSGWCSGARVPKVDVIIDISEYLHVTPGDLIAETKAPYYTPEELDFIELYRNSDSDGRHLARVALERGQH